MPSPNRKEIKNFINFASRFCCFCLSLRLSVFVRIVEFRQKIGHFFGNYFIYCDISSVFFFFYKLWIYHRHRMMTNTTSHFKITVSKRSKQFKTLVISSTILYSSLTFKIKVSDAIPALDIARVP